MATARSVDGTRIAIDRYGEGPPLVLVVGAFCDRSTPSALAASAIWTSVRTTPLT